MKLVFIIGNSAVGKMTVGQELEKITGLRLFHNHMIIEPILQIFHDFRIDLINEIRELIFRRFAETDNEGMIFTMMWAFDEPEDREYVEMVKKIFEDQGGEVYFVELTAPQDVRLLRNETENRLKNKASKRNLEFSRNLLIKGDAEHRFESLPGEIPYENYIRMNNKDLSAEDAAKWIKEYFVL
ncbi:MAG: shikimate kinase [Clostridiales bacterium]|nr:shikimate kinase [Clostridiales bacterium]